MNLATQPPLAQSPLAQPLPSADLSGLGQSLLRCRAHSLELVEGLSDADLTVQSMDDSSPAKWHLAHTTWFFEEFVLSAYAPGYKPFDPGYRFLFNSYYEAVGARHPRPQRGLLTRPAIAEVLAYRSHVDEAMQHLLAAAPPRAALDLIELGVQHEQQHQELLLTDLLHLFAQNPLLPAWRIGSQGAAAEQAGTRASDSVPLAWIEFDGGCFEVGHDSQGFAFDCELPRHRVLLEPYALADRLVTNAEWLEFIEDGGYRSPQLWLSDGWRQVQGAGWQAPLYWHRPVDTTKAWRHMSLFGDLPLDPSAPVSHVSFFEADAFARWTGARLPTEFEWEVAARGQDVAGNLGAAGLFCPRTAALDAQRPLRQLYGDVWEWTSSPYSPYPRFNAAPGAVGEYNGKFMCGQFVLRGGSCVTPADHVRASYRNFFYPHQRWQFTGLRLARR